MKKQNIFMIAMAALAMTACSSDEQTYDGPVAARISAGVSGSATKALNDVWEADEIGVTVVDAPNSEMEALYKNVKYVTEATTSAAANFTSDAPICFQDSEEEVTFSAYGPYQSELGADGSVAVNTAKQSTRAEQRPFDFIYASGAKASKANPTVEFKKVPDGDNHAFAHKMTRLVLVVKAGDLMSFDEVKAAAITLGGLKHEGTFNAYTGVAAASGEAVADWSLANAMKAEGTDALTFTAILLPQALASTLAFKATIADVVYANNTAINPALKAGTSYTYTITVKCTGLEVSGCTIGGWEDAGDVVEGDAEEAGYTLVKSVWHIYNAEGLQAWAAEKAANDWKRCNAVLENDIVMPAPAAGESNWTPVENYDGVFDGNGKTISGLVIRGATTDNQGFFANIVGNSDEIGVVKNLTLKNVTIESTASYVGGIAGDCCGNIYGCHVTGTLKGNNMVGGLTGLYAPANYAALYACSAQCDVSGYSSVGGLMGYAQQGAALACWADCVMTSTDEFQCGYLAGSMGSDFVFSACYWTGTGVDNPVGWTRLADGSYAYPTAGTTKVDGTSRTWANATSDMNRELATNTNVSSDFTYRWYQATGSESNPPVLKK